MDLVPSPSHISHYVGKHSEEPNIPLANVQPAEGFLTLSSRSLSSWPAGVTLCNTIRQIDLSYNAFTEFPSELFALEVLEVLSITHNSLSSLPPCVANFLHLYALHLNDNKLETVPSELAELPQLRHLSLHNNQLEHLPFELIQLIPRLIHISMDGNPALPKSTILIYSALYSRTTMLELDGCGLPEDFPEIGELYSLDQLSLRYNQLQRVPPQLGRLFELQLLNLDHNELEALPAEVMHLTELKSLYVEYNRLATLPLTLSCLCALTELKLSHNCLHKLPEGIFPSLAASLQLLDLDHNQLESLPEDIGVLRELRILRASHNRLVQLPTSVGGLVRVEVLHLHHNQLACVPHEMIHMAMLRELTLNDNRITAIPLHVYQLPRMRNITLENNPLPQSFARSQFSVSLAAPEQISSPPPATRTPPAAAVPLSDEPSPKPVGRHRSDSTASLSRDKVPQLRLTALGQVASASRLDKPPGESATGPPSPPSAEPRTPRPHFRHTSSLLGTFASVTPRRDRSRLRSSTVTADAPRRTGKTSPIDMPSDSQPALQSPATDPGPASPPPTPTPSPLFSPPPSSSSALETFLKAPRNLHTGVVRRDALDRFLSPLQDKASARKMQFDTQDLAAGSPAPHSSSSSPSAAAHASPPEWLSLHTLGRTVESFKAQRARRSSLPYSTSLVARQSADGALSWKASSLREPLEAAVPCSALADDDDVPLPTKRGRPRGRTGDDALPQQSAPEAVAVWPSPRSVWVTDSLPASQLRPAVPVPGAAATLHAAAVGSEGSDFSPLPSPAVPVPGGNSAELLRDSNGPAPTPPSLSEPNASSIPQTTHRPSKKHRRKTMLVAFRTIAGVFGKKKPKAESEKVYINPLWQRGSIGISITPEGSAFGAQTKHCKSTITGPAAMGNGSADNKPRNEPTKASLKSTRFEGVPPESSSADGSPSLSPQSSPASSPSSSCTPSPRSSTSLGDTDGPEATSIAQQARRETRSLSEPTVPPAGLAKPTLNGRPAKDKSGRSPSKPSKRASLGPWLFRRGGRKSVAVVQQENDNERVRKQGLTRSSNSVLSDERTAQELFRWQERETGHGGTRDKGRRAVGVRAGGGDHERPRSFIAGLDPETLQGQVELAHKDDGSVAVRGGTLEGLVALLLHERGHDPDYEYAFLVTFRLFVVATDLLEALSARLHAAFVRCGPHFAAVAERLLRFLRRWIEMHPYDFRSADHDDDADSGRALDRLMVLIGEATAAVPALSEAAEELRQFVQRRLQASYEPPHADGDRDEQPPVPYLPINVASFEIKLLDLHPQEVARQLTLIEHTILRSVAPCEWLKTSVWTKNAPAKHSASSAAPNIVAMITRFNDVSRWVSTELVCAETLEHRVVLLNRFIIIAQKCKELRNYNAVMEILSGLESASVQRLKQTWMNLPSKAWKIFTELSELMSMSNNFKALREQLESAEPPCVPYIGLFLKDLLFTVDGNPDHLDNGMVNFEKQFMIAKIVKLLEKFKPVQYSLIPVEFIQDYLLNVRTLDDTQLYNESLQREGRIKGGDQAMSPAKKKAATQNKTLRW